MTSTRSHKHTGSVTQNQKAQLANAYNELGKELSSSRIRVVGNYTLGKSIGEGAYGKVRMGTHRLTSTRVAIKQIPKAMSASLTREIHHHRQLHHPHVTQMYEVIATENSIWIVTELCCGGELFDYLVEKGRLSEDETKIIFGQLCLAVAYLHDKGIVHRDLKLENVLLDERCRVKLGDFGFTREYERGIFLETFCGTTGYAAPEMLQGHKYLGPEVDIWSLGIILYCLLTGGLPFDDDDESVMRDKIISGKFEDPEWLSDESRDLIKSILVKEPAKRLPISSILTHSWFTARDSLPVRADTVDSHTSSDASDSHKLFGDDIHSSTPTTPDEKEDKVLHRSTSEITIRKAELETLHTKLTIPGPQTVIEEDEASPPPRMSSNISLAPPPVTRTPARTKRRSVSSIPSDPADPVEEVEETEILTPEVPAAAADASQPQVSFASLLSTPAPVIFSTPPERELLNSLSLYGFDIAQIVHSVLTDACDATGALWWMLKRRAEKRSIEPHLEDVTSPGIVEHPIYSLGEQEASSRRQTSVGTQTETQFALSSRGPALPHLSFVPPTPTVSSGRPSTPPGPSSPTRSPLLSPSASGTTTGESTSRSHPSTPASSLKDREGKGRKGRSGSVSIMQRATTALEAAGLVRKKSSEAFKDEKDDKKSREPERKGSSGEEGRSSHGSLGPSTSSKLTKSPPLRPSKDHNVPSTPPPSEDHSQPAIGSPWVLTASKDSLHRPPTPANSPGGDIRASMSSPNFGDGEGTGSTGKASGSHRNRANLLTAFRLWFNEDRKGKRKQNSPTVGPSTSNSNQSFAGNGRGSAQQTYSTTSVKRRTSGPGKFVSRGHRHRASASSRRSSSVNSRRSSITSVQMIVLDSPQVPGRRSFGSHTPNSERGEHGSRPSSIRSFSMQRQHRKSPSASSTGSNNRTTSPVQKLHRRAGSGSSTRVVRHVQTTTITTTPLTSRPPHMRSNSASSTHSPVSSRPNSIYEQPLLQRSNSDIDRYRTGSPFKSNSRPQSRTRTSSSESRGMNVTTTTSTTFVAQKRLGPFTSPSFNGSIGRTSWKKSWGLEPPGWQTRTAHIPIEVLAISPINEGATIRDVFSSGSRHGLGLSTMNSFGDESDWVDEDDDLPTFAGGLGQMWSAGPSQSKPSPETITLSPAPRGHRPNKRTNRSGSGSSTSSAGGKTSKAGHSPSLNTTPLPSETVYESVSGRRQIPGHGRKGPAAIQEEDEEAEEE
ncbi:Serine/threonine-protein kinase MARK2 [Mycena indigotica]|uniref:Serine/threonine-protein kinase MARK2 n=1 Tax=Mycena indigotica TaxID=2126181 RepID=A0A8H6SQ77_9AGAR|nr:Serine/threonine-protein kinase MARK2 [Mycena indigotica]KAF7303808.1 Serine/threonine-protein kinase MARK2 [Mycena indigotica]